MRTLESLDFVAQEPGINKKAASLGLKSVVKSIQDSLITRDGVVRIPDLAPSK
ncbi:MAG: hypothetical protein V1897_17755 [Pseudomonadota bacterium]